MKKVKKIKILRRKEVNENMKKTIENTNDVLRRKCVECEHVFESSEIKCPNCKSKKTTCSFKELIFSE